MSLMGHNLNHKKICDFKGRKSFKWLHWSVIWVWNVTSDIKKDHRLRMFENSVLRRISGPKRNEITGGWRKLHNEKLHNLHSLPNIITMTMSGKIRWAGYVACIGKKCFGGEIRQKETTRKTKTYMRIVGGGVQTGSTRHPGHLLSHCACPGWLWGWRIIRWNEDWHGKPKYSETTCPSATLSTTNPTWPDPGSNPGRRGGKPATNRLRYGAARPRRKLEDNIKME
jgi:hypothetical protein